MLEKMETLFSIIWVTDIPASIFSLHEHIYGVFEECSENLHEFCHLSVPAAVLLPGDSAHCADLIRTGIFQCSLN